MGVLKSNNPTLADVASRMETNRETNRETGGSFRRALAQRAPGAHPVGPLAFVNQNPPARGLSFIVLIDSRECMHRVS